MILLAVLSAIIYPRDKYLTTEENEVTQDLVGRISVYENKTYSIRVEYPEEWQAKRLDNERDLTLEDPITKEIVKFYPNNLALETGLPYISISVAAVPENFSLDEYTKSSIESILSFLPEPRMLDSEPLVIANRQGHKIVYAGKQFGLSTQNLSAWFLEDNQSYRITYSSKANEYSQFESVADGILESLRILN